MSDTVSDLDKLLGDVRKTIQDNQQFLKALVADAVDDDDDVDDDKAEAGQAGEEEYEEL